MLWCKWTGLAAVSLALLVACIAWASSPGSWLRRAYSGYCAYLDRRLRRLLSPVAGRTVAAGQVAAAAAVVACDLTVELPGGCCWIAPIAFGPAWWLGRLGRRRLAALERQLEGFVATLANCLKVTPNVATALGSLPFLLPRPLRDEVGLVNRELRLGAGLDDALLAMAARVGSRQFDSVLRALVIGRRVGGDLPRILESTASALRELARLEGVVQARTSEARAQLAVLALCPFAIVVLLAAISPGYFAPLQSSLLGWGIALAAGLLWLGALAVARRVMAVKL
jgi:tight adherence protein B